MVAAEPHQLVQGGASLGEAAAPALDGAQLEQAQGQIGVGRLEKAAAHVDDLLVQGLGSGVIALLEEAKGQIVPHPNRVRMVLPQGRAIQLERHRGVHPRQLVAAPLISQGSEVAVGFCQVSLIALVLSAADRQGVAEAPAGLVELPFPQGDVAQSVPVFGQRRSRPAQPPLFESGRLLEETTARRVGLPVIATLPSAVRFSAWASSASWPGSRTDRRSARDFPRAICASP